MRIIVDLALEVRKTAMSRTALHRRGGCRDGRGQITFGTKLRWCPLSRRPHRGESLADKPIRIPCLPLFNDAIFEGLRFRVASRPRKRKCSYIFSEPLNTSSAGVVGSKKRDGV